jgi:hypothetical protein
MKLITKHKRQMAAAGLSEAAIQELLDLYYNYMVKEILIHADPHVYGTFSVRLVREETVEYKHAGVAGSHTYLNDVDLLWYKGGYDECEFETWPPTSNGNNLQFL